MFNKFMCFVIISNLFCQTINFKLKEIIKWKVLDYKFPNEQMKNDLIQENEFIKINNVPLDVDVFYKDKKPRIFVTIPRFMDGIPVTLGYIDNPKHGTKNPLIQPYPDFESQSLDCGDGIVSAGRIAIDECNRLWVMDTGALGLANSFICDPQILVYDLTNDTLIHKYKIPKEQYISGKSFFITIIVDVKDKSESCSNTFAYIADARAFSLLVYDLSQDKSWLVQNKYFYPDPEQGTFNIEGDTFDLMTGIIGLAITPKNSKKHHKSGEKNKKRYLHFHPLSSTGEYTVPLDLIDNSTIWESNSESNSDDFKLQGNHISQSAAMAMDNKGYLYYGLLSNSSIARWNTNKPFTRGNHKIIDEDRKRLQFPSGVKVIKNHKGSEYLWILTDRLQKQITGTLSPNETNFRIFADRI